MLVRTCLCLISRGAGDEREILLGYKKTGFGAGRWVGLGGHIEEGEKPVEAAVREVAEESGLVVPPDSLHHAASLTFLFPFRPSWDQSAEVFITSQYSGEPAESDEVVPTWFPASELPFDRMWDDARHWVPLVLRGERVAVTITFAADCATVSRIEPELGAPPPEVSGR